MSPVPAYQQPCCPAVCVAFGPQMAQQGMYWMPSMGGAPQSMSGMPYMVPFDAAWSASALQIQEAAWGMAPQPSLQQQAFMGGHVPVQASMHDLQACDQGAIVDSSSRSALRRWRKQRATVRPQVEELSMATDNSQADGNASRELADELLALLRSGEAGRQEAASRFRHLAFASKSSSRTAQLAIEEARGSDAAALAAGLHGHVYDAVRSMYANYVLQRIIELLPSASTAFISNELLGVAAEVARHRFGCRIFCRLVEHGSLTDQSTARLFEEVLADAKSLSRHSFGNYVLRHLLEYGQAHHQLSVVQALHADILGNAEHPFGSRVMETALQFSSVEERRRLASALLQGGPELLCHLAEGQCSCHVVKELLRMPDEIRRQAVDYLQPVSPQLRQSKYGKHVVKVL